MICSVVLGTYNRLPLLKKTIRSLECDDVEIIVNDAGSTDGTIEWLSKLNVVLILSEKKTGITNSYNECFKMATGKYVTWFSDDLIAHQDSIKNMCDLMDSLSPKDMGAFYMNRRNGFSIPTFRGFLCPPVGCMYLETLKKYEYWSQDYPHYSQDLEISFKVLRMGGKIESREGIKVIHNPIADDLKVENTKKHRQIGGPSKFQLVAGNYGKRLNTLYPNILVDNVDLIRKFSKYYRNINIYTDAKKGLQFDLIINNGKILFPHDLPIKVKKFGEQIIND